MRRPLAPALALTTVVALAGCAGTEDHHADQVTDLDAGQARAALIDASALGDGYRAGDPTNVKPKDAKTPFAEVPAAPQACKDAAKAFADDAKAEPKAYAKRVLARTDKKANVQVAIQVGDKTRGLPEELTKISEECGPIHASDSGHEITLTSTAPDLGVDGARSLQITIEAGTARVVTDLGLKAIGDNLTVVQSASHDESTSRDLAAKALKAQVDKVQKAAS